MSDFAEAVQDSAPIGGSEPSSTNGAESGTSGTSASAELERTHAAQSGVERAFERAQQHLAKNHGDMRTGRSQASPNDGERAMKAPERWPQSRREYFERAPDDVKRELLALNSDWSKGYERSAHEAKSHREFVSQVKEMFADGEIAGLAQQAGLDAVGAIRHSLDLVRMFNRNPIGFMMEVCRRRGIDPRSLVDGSPQNQSYSNEIGPLLQKVQALEAVHHHHEFLS